MELPLLYNDLVEFRTYVKKTLGLRIGAWVNLLYFIIAVGAFFLIAHADPATTSYIAKDFSAFYTAVEILQMNPAGMYNSAFFEYPFRYLPIFAYFFAWLKLFSFPIAYFVFNGIMMGYNYISWFFMYELAKRYYHVDMEREIPQKGLFLFILCPLHLMNYMLGQINSMFICILLCSMFFLENEKQNPFCVKWGNFWAGFFLGFAIILKPIAILIVPFVLEITFKALSGKKIDLKLKTTLVRLLGIGLILSTNILVFLQYPGLFQGFIDMNFQSTLDFHHSTSLTRLIIDILKSWGESISKLELILFFTAMGFIVPMFYFLREDKSKVNFSNYFSYAMLIFMLSYPDSWFLYLIIWYAIYFPAFTQLGQKIQLKNPDKKPQFAEKSFWLMIRLINYNLIYFTLGVLCYYFLLGFDPLAPISILLIFFILLKGHEK